MLGLSGGIDSALVALIAVDALGPGRVTCVSMPSPYSSEGTRADARAIAEQSRHGVPRAVDRGRDGELRGLLADVFEGTDPGIAEENLQARIRGNVVMALSNKFGWLVLTTGNKSELSVGYATLYGDMAGGLAVLKDVYKGLVYRLVRWRNAVDGRELVPASVLERPPSAELRHEQLDEDSLPPYDVLDAILEGYVEEDLDAAELAARGLPADERRARDRHGRPRGVQAPPGPAGDQDLHPRLRTRPAAADHERLPQQRLGGRLRAAPARAQLSQRGARTAIVTREMAQSLPSSSVKSTSQTQVVRPRWRTVASACTLPEVTGRRKVVLFDWPMATLPSPDDRHVGGGRHERLGERRVGAAVHEPEGLAHAVLDRKAAAGLLRPRLEDLEAEHLVERPARDQAVRKLHIAHSAAAYSSPFVATFDQLSEEQRAVVELVLRRGKDYEELAEMLGMPEARVRELARDALLDLAPLSGRGVEEDWRGQLADYVLGQQSGPEATATRGHLRRSEAARTWARSLMDSLEQLYDNGSMPAIPRGGARRGPHPQGRGGRRARRGSPAST